MLSNYIYEVIVKIYTNNKTKIYHTFFTNMNDAQIYIMNIDLNIDNLTTKSNHKLLEISIKKNNLVYKLYTTRNYLIKQPISNIYKYKLDIQLLEFVNNYITYNSYSYALNFVDFMSCMNNICKFLLDNKIEIYFNNIEKIVYNVLSGISFILDINDFTTPKNYYIYFYFINNDQLIKSSKIIDYIYDEYIERLSLNQYYNFISNNYNLNRPILPITLPFNESLEIKDIPIDKLKI